jgi:hypothetical protein
MTARRRVRPPDINDFAEDLATDLLNILEPGLNNRQVRELRQLAEHADRLRPDRRRDMAQIFEHLSDRGRRREQRRHPPSTPDRQIDGPHPRDLRRISEADH